MARYGCTITVATGKIPSSRSNFVWLATEANFPATAIDGGATSILNGGGNLRCYTDSTKTTRLPIEVVTFVTGGSPQVHIRGLSPTLGNLSTVYIEADQAETSQPPVNDTYGRNSVWVDRITAVHSDPTTDSTGNATPVATNTSSGVTFNSINTIRFNGSNSRIDTPVSISYPFTLSCWVNLDQTGDTIQAVADSSVTNRFERSISSSNSFFTDGFTGTVRRATAPTPIGTGNFYLLTSVFTSESLRSAAVNGDSEGADNQAISAISWDRYTIGTDADSTPFSWLYGDGCLFELRNYAITEDERIAAYNNQFDPASFWTTSAWEDQDAGGGFQSAWAANANQLINMV